MAGAACAGSCWRGNLASLVPNCNQFNDAGFRACLETTVTGANQACQ